MRRWVWRIKVKGEILFQIILISLSLTHCFFKVIERGSCIINYSAWTKLNTITHFIYSNVENRKVLEGSQASGSPPIPSASGLAYTTYIKGKISYISLPIQNITSISLQTLKLHLYTPKTIKITYISKIIF